LSTTKQSQALALLHQGRTKEALKLFSGFKLGVTPQQSKKLKTAYECTVHPDFYRQLGVEIDLAVAEAVEMCHLLFGPSKNT
jgi:hypothetical protein